MWAPNPPPLPVCCLHSPTQTQHYPKTDQQHDTFYNCTVIHLRPFPGRTCPCRCVRLSAVNGSAPATNLHVWGKATPAVIAQMLPRFLDCQYRPTLSSFRKRKILSCLSSASPVAIREMPKEEVSANPRSSPSIVRVALAAFWIRSCEDSGAGERADSMFSIAWTCTHNVKGSQIDSMLGPEGPQRHLIYTGLHHISKRLHTSLEAHGACGMLQRTFGNTVGTSGPPLGAGCS